MAILSTGYRPLASCPAQPAGAQRLCAMAHSGCAGVSANTSVVGGRPAVLRTVLVLLCLTHRVACVKFCKSDHGAGVIRVGEPPAIIGCHYVLAPPAERIVPEVHGGDPRIAQRPSQVWRSDARGVPVDPRGQVAVPVWRDIINLARTRAAARPHRSHPGRDRRPLATSRRWRPRARSRAERRAKPHTRPAT